MLSEGITGPEGRRYTEEYVSVLGRLAVYEAESVAILKAAGVPDELIGRLPGRAVSMLRVSALSGWRYNPEEHTYDRLLKIAESLHMSTYEAGRMGGKCTWRRSPDQFPEDEDDGSHD